MQCQICGTLLSDRIMKCPTCGATAQPDDLNSPYELQEEVIPFIDYPGRRAATTSPPVKQTAPFLYGTPQVPIRPPAIQPGASLSAYKPGALQQPVESDSQPRRSISAGLAALLVILAFLLVGGGGFGYYLIKVQSAELNAQATAVVQNILTAQARASVEALATFTSKSPQDIYNQVTGRAPDMSDPLSQQDSNFWINFHTPGLACFFSQGTYHTLDTESPSYN